MKTFFLVFFLLLSANTHAQWAVYDDTVKREIEKINKVERRSIDRLADFERFEGLDVDFSKLTSLTEAEKDRYVGTKEDCGDQRLNLKHYEACQGLRNLRLQTLKQSQSVLAVLDRRRRSIDKLIDDARSIPGESGAMQRYQFELQGLHVQMQSDAFKLQVLMDGYKQREKAYEMQMAEARRVSDTRPNSLVNLGPVPFVPPPR